jgi:DNA helicase-2/ATP-dependent DNA helicase PcrA
MNPTDEQIAIIDAIENSTSNLCVNALAGTGKTTTLDFIQSASPKQPVMCLAFNKRIAEEMKKKFPDTTAVKTMNGLGHGIWYKAVGKLDLNPKKMNEIFKEQVKALAKPDQQEAWDVYWEVITACSMAKSLGYVPEGKFPHAKRLITQELFHQILEVKPTQVVSSLIDSLLFQSIQSAYKGWIDYNDQVYMPGVFGGTFPRFPLVLVDEAQDLNPVNHAILGKLVRERVCVVGDRWQSIYAFRGAVTNGMQDLQAKFSCQELDLSVSFRCPQAVVEAARWRVPNFKWTKPGGHVEVLRRLPSASIPEGAAIICRNNAPLFRTALGLLMQRRAVTVSGSELGPKLIRLLEKVCDEGDTQEEMLGKIEAWKEEQISKAQHIDNIVDTAECLMIFASFGKDLGQAVTYVKHMFEQQGSIKLLTGHKAKGGEWDIVYHLDPWLCRDEEQDKNLRYVITTRAKESLYEIDSRNIIW